MILRFGNWFLALGLYRTKTNKLACVRHPAILLGPDDDCPICKTWARQAFVEQKWVEKDAGNV